MNRSMNIFAEMAHSVYDFGSYASFRKNGKWKTFLYGLAVDLIYILTVFFPLILSLVLGGGMKGVLSSNMPEFTFSNGKLQVEEPAEFTAVNVFLRMNTDRPVTEEVTETDLLAFDNAVVMDAENMLVKSEGQIVRISYSELAEEMGLEYLDKAILLDELAPLFQGVLIFVVILMEVLFFLGALAVATIGAMMASGQRHAMGFGELYKMALHARTVPLILKAVLNYLPFGIPYFFVLNFGISGYYMWRALREPEQAQGYEEWRGE